ELARIDNEAAVLEAVIEGLKDEFRIARHVEGDDDRRLQPVRKQRLEAEGAHTIDQRLAIGGIAPAAPRDAALGNLLRERLVKRYDDMDRRGKAPLLRLLHSLPLLEQIEGERCRIALAALERRQLADDEPDPRHSFEALVARCRKRLEGGFAGIDRQRAESAHRVEQETPAAALHHRRDFRDRVEDAARRLAIDEEDMG